MTQGQVGTVYEKRVQLTHLRCKAGCPSVLGHFQWHLVTDRVSEINISFVEYSASKKVRLQPDIVEYSPGDQAPMYDLIIGKQTMHNQGIVLDFQKKTIQIDENLCTHEEHC